MDPLFEKGWINFNEKQWGLRAESIVIVPDKGSSWELRTVLYYDKDGRLVMPGRNSYLPISFECTSSKSTVIAGAKTEATTKLAEVVVAGKPRGSIALSPVLNDIRPFQWAGFNVFPRYTYILSLQDWSKYADKRLLRHLRRAKEQGYYCELTDDMDLVQYCLGFSEERKGFSHSVSTENIRLLINQLGKERFLASICYSKDKQPVGARLTLCSPGHMAHAWSAGLSIEALRAGCNPLLFEFVAEELLKKNCTSIDLVGANIPGVARAKSAFGGELTVYYSIERRTIRNIMKQCYHWIRSSERAFN